MNNLSLLKNHNAHDIYADMLIQFPKEELKSYECFENLLKDEDYNIYSAVDNDVKVGYVVLYNDKHNKTLWLDYLAVYKDFHSKGYGSLILKAMKKHFSDSDPNQNINIKGIWLEVEKPDPKKPNTIRRISFYERLGAIKVNCEYFYPNTEGALPMDLYFLPFQKYFMPDCEFVLSSIKNAFTFLHCDLPHHQAVFNEINFD